MSTGIIFKYACGHNVTRLFSCPTVTRHSRSEPVQYISDASCPACLLQDSMQGRIDAATVEVRARAELITEEAEARVSPIHGTNLVDLDRRMRRLYERTEQCCAERSVGLCGCDNPTPPGTRLSSEVLEYLKEEYRYENLSDVDPTTWECIEESARENTAEVSRWDWELIYADIREGGKHDISP